MIALPPTPVRDRRRRHRRLLGRVSSGARGLEGRGAARAQAADLRLHLARRGAGRPAADQRQRHPAAQTFGRAVRPPRGRDRAGLRLEAERRPAPCLQRRSPGRDQASGDHRAQLRARDAPALAHRGEGSLAADGCLRRGRRRVPADRRPGQSVRHRPGAGQGRPPAGRADRRGLRRHRLSDRARPDRGRADRPGRDRLRGGGAVRRAVVEGARPAWPACACRSSRCSTST